MRKKKTIKTTPKTMYKQCIDRNSNLVTCSEENKTMNANARIAMSKQLEYRAPWLASLKVQVYSESVKNRVMYALSEFLIDGQITLQDKETGDEVYRWNLYDLWTWDIEGARLHKRIKSAIYKKTGFNLSDALLRTIADIAATERNSDDIWVDVTTDFSWDSGDYGDDGSCYWGSYSSARTKYLPKLGASAVRSYETRDNGECGYGSGRGWIYPVPLFNPENEDIAVYVAFNPYGLYGDNHGTFAAVCAVAAELQNGKPYKWIKLYDHNVDGCYVNGHDFLIYPSDLDLSTLLSEDTFLQSVTGNDSPRYAVNVSYTTIESVNCPVPHWAPFYGNGYDEREIRARCCNCGNRCNEDNGTYEEGDFYCEDCYCEVFSSCEFCENTCLSEDIHNVDDHYICENCRDRYATQCDHCSMWHITSRPRWHVPELHTFYDVMSGSTDETWCNDCFEDDSFICSECDISYDNSQHECMYDGSDCLCGDCAQARAQENDTESVDNSPNVLTGQFLVTDAHPYMIDAYGNKWYTVVSGYSAASYVTESMFLFGYDDLRPQWRLTEDYAVIPF